MIAWMLAASSGVLSLLLSALLVSKHRRLREVEKSRTVVEQQLDSSQRELKLLIQDQRLQTRFITEFLDLSKRMDSLASSRTIPATLLEMIQKTFEPAAAMVLIQKPSGPRRFTAVAIHPSSSAIRMGMEFAAHEGELGLVVRAQRVMTKEDFLQSSYQSSIVGNKKSLPGFVMHLAAPMIFEGEIYGVLCVSQPKRMPAASREVMGLIAQLGALTYHNSAAYHQIKKTAQHDELTQIANKASVLQALEREIDRSRSQGHETSIFLFDVDNFKNFNDVNGHMAGDELLRDLARLVQQSTRDYDIVGRFGGEEFLVVLPETDSKGAMAVAEKVRSRIAQEDFAHREKQPLGCMSVSGGVATFPESGRDSETLMKLADEALYAAKEGGRNRVKRARLLAVQTTLSRPISA